MPGRTELARGRVAGRAILAALVVLAVVPAYLALPASRQPVAARVVGAAAVAFGCARALRWLRRTAEPVLVSPLDAPTAAGAAPELDGRVVALRDDLLSSTRQRRYFDAILWPRLLRLAGGQLAPPAERRAGGGRGPSLEQIEELVEQIERRG